MGQYLSLERHHKNRLFGIYITSVCRSLLCFVYKIVTLCVFGLFYSAVWFSEVYQYKFICSLVMLFISHIVCYMRIQCGVNCFDVVLWDIVTCGNTVKKFVLHVIKVKYPYINKIKPCRI